MSPFLNVPKRNPNSNPTLTLALTYIEVGTYRDGDTYGRLRVSLGTIWAYCTGSPNSSTLYSSQFTGTEYV